MSTEKPLSKRRLRPKKQKNTGAEKTVPPDSPEAALPALRNCELFKGHTDEQILQLMPCFCPRIQLFRKDEAIAIAGQPQKVFGIVLTGEVMIQKEDYAGNRLIIGIMGPSELIGEVSVYAGTYRWPNNVFATTASTVMFLPYEKISQPCCNVCQSHQLLIGNMLSIVARKAIAMNNRINYLKLRGMREKLAAYLFEQQLQAGSHNFMVPLKREELADYLNVSRPSMSRELSRMRSEGIIDFYRSSFTIKDLDALRQI
ncbi:MAG: Crp/Fnr family transcriptional regulator [Saccharofermentanales bacterium]|jgi:CRP-like cAMP-binding protein